MSNSTISCNFCQSDIHFDSSLGNLAICNNCHSSFRIDEIKQKQAAKKRNLYVIGAVLVTLAIAGKVLGLYDDRMTKLQKSVNEMSLSAALTQEQVCLRENDTECLVLIYQRLAVLDPSNVTYQANHAIRLTRLARYAEASPIYEKLVTEGQGTYDLMAYYGINLDALGETAKAIEWFQNSLSLYPNLVDVTQKLAVALTKDKRLYEASSLLDGFIARFPDTEGTLKGNLIAIKSQIQNDKTTESAEAMKLLTIRGAHFYMPVQLTETSAPASFVVDTGASDFVMKTADLTKAFPESIRTAEKVRISLADGRTVPAYKTVIPEIKIGTWKLKNIETIFCDDCVNLAGRSVLSRFSMKTIPKGELETLELTLAK